MTSSPIDDYIRATRDQYTREAITDQLLASGHERAAIEAAWDTATAGDAVPGHAAGMEGREIDSAARVAVGLLAGIGALLTVLSLLGYGGMGVIGWSLAITLLVVSPVAWFWRRRPLGPVALGMFLLLLPEVVLIGLVGASYLGRPGPVIWIALYLIGGGLLVWQAFRWRAPRSAWGWVLGVLGTAVLVLLVAGGTCLVSIPFMQA